jgi:hypothetical protein
MTKEGTIISGDTISRDKTINMEISINSAKEAETTINVFSRNRKYSTIANRGTIIKKTGRGRTKCFDPSVKSNTYYDG